MKLETERVPHAMVRSMETEPVIHAMERSYALGEDLEEKLREFSRKVRSKICI
jgi:hypothetical protein